MIGKPIPFTHAFSRGMRRDYALIYIMLKKHANHLSNARLL